MIIRKGKKPGLGNQQKSVRGVDSCQQSSTRPDGVFNLDDDIQGYRRKKASIDGIQKHNYGGNISFDSADKLGEEIAALRTRK